MKRTRIRSRTCVSVLFAVILFFPSAMNSAVAASPQQNNQEIVKALKKMKEGLLKAAGQSKQKESVPQKLKKHFPPEKRDNQEIDNRTPSIPEEKSAHSLPGLSERKILEKSTTKSAIKPTANSKTDGIKPVPDFHSFIVEAISIKDNELDVNFRGTLSFNILKDSSNNVLAVDLISPSLVPPQFRRHLAIKIIPPSPKSIIRYAVTYLHNEKNDKLMTLYHKPFLRISMFLKKATKYRIEKSKNLLRIKLLSDQPASGSFRESKKNPTAKHFENRKQKPESKTPYTLKAEAIPIEISQQSISRIVSPYAVKKVIYSREQRIQIEVSGRNIYIKPLPTKLLMPDGSFALQYSKDPKDIFIITSRKVYSLHLIPEKIPSVTYKLKPVEETSPEDYKEAEKLFLNSIHGGPTGKPSSDSYISRIIYLLKEIYTGNLPPDYRIFPLKRNFTVGDKYSVTGQYEIITGEGTVDVYQVKAMKPTALSEIDFVKELGKVSAVTVLNSSLSPGETTYLYAVYMGVNNEE